MPASPQVNSLVIHHFPYDKTRSRPSNNRDHDSPLCLQQDLRGLGVNIGLPQRTMCGLRCANDQRVVSPASFQRTVPSDIFEHMAPARHREREDAP
jgi:hypothetical protein